MLKKITVCPFGYYGKDCTGRCSIHCYYTSLCDRFTGLCTRGCKAGWTGNMCDRRNFCFYISAYMYNLVIKKKTLMDQSIKCTCIQILGDIETTGVYQDGQF